MYRVRLMYNTFFEQFLNSTETLQIYKDGELLFSSDREGLLPLVDYLESTKENRPEVVILDRVTGNAAAMLAILAGCVELHSRTASQMAVETLKKYPIRCYFARIVPYIQQPENELMCPTEELSLGKTPGEFYQALLEKIGQEG